MSLQKLQLVFEFISEGFDRRQRIYKDYKSLNTTFKEDFYLKKKKDHYVE